MALQPTSSTEGHYTARSNGRSRPLGREQADHIFLMHTRLLLARTIGIPASGHHPLVPIQLPGLDMDKFMTNRVTDLPQAAVGSVSNSRICEVPATTLTARHS